MGRAPCCDKTKVKRGPWSPEEDNTLKNYLEKNGTGGNWISLPQKAGLRRCGKSCRLRWLNYLRPDIKHGGFTEEEDNIILTLYSQIGSRWSVIAANLQGRTDNDVKNHWNTKLKKKLLASQNNTNLITTSSYNFTNINVTSSDHDFNDHNFSRNNYYGTLDYYSNTFTSHMDPNSTNHSTCQFPLPALMEIQENDGATIQEDGYNFMDFSSGISSSSSSYYDDRVVQCKEHSTLAGFGKRSHPRVAKCTEHPTSAGSREELYPKVAQCTEYFASTESKKRSHTKQCDVCYDDILENGFDFQENDIGSYYNILEIDQLLKGFDQN